jgi:ubiquinone/menaquinone biosynthesis C-methylase UbiE
LRPTAEGYTAWAETYDQAANPILHLEGPVMAELFASLEPGRALDAACGTGRHAAVLARLGHEVVGVDANPAMLARARERLPEGDFRAGQLDALPLEDGSVDLVVCSLALTHLDDPTPAIAELVRVVRPGGRIVLSDVHPSWIALGAQAAFRDADERRGYVRNHIHWVSTYLRAFTATGLDVLDCRELPYGRAETDLWIDRQDIDINVAYEALVGMPAVLFWELART